MSLPDLRPPRADVAYTRRLCLNRRLHVSPICPPLTARRRVQRGEALKAPSGNQRFFPLGFSSIQPFWLSDRCDFTTVGFPITRRAKPMVEKPLSSIVCLAQPVRSAQFCEPVITGSSTVAERSRYPLDRSDLLFSGVFPICAI
ncbi:hypothetical protein GQ457_17G000010 [Hibiscus cannabinus]